MKIARFAHNGVTRVGVLVDDDAIRLLATDVSVFDLLAAAPSEREALVTRAAETLVRSDDARWLAPIVPPSVRDFISFEEHIQGMVKPSGNPVKPEWYEGPSCYYANPAAVWGPFDDVPVPPGCEVFDFELEVAAVIGTAGSNLTVAEAGAHIAAYTIFNDWSARDIQRIELTGIHGPVKAKDSTTTLGPMLVTADELEPFRKGDRLDLELQVSLNGEPFGNDTLANLGYSFEQMLVYASRGTRLVTGDVIGSGTCGSGCLGEIWGRRGRQEPPPLKPGDVVEMTVQGIGTIRNRVVAGLPVHATGGAVTPAPYRRERSW